MPNTWPYYNAFGMENEAFCSSTTELNISLKKLLHKNKYYHGKSNLQFSILSIVACTVHKYISVSISYIWRDRHVLVRKRMLSILNGITVMCHRNSYILGMTVCGGREEGINKYTRK